MVCNKFNSKFRATMLKLDDYKIKIGTSTHYIIKVD